MGGGAFIEPLIVISFLVGGIWINRARNKADSQRTWGEHKRDDSSSSSSSSSRSGSIAVEEGILGPRTGSQSPPYLSQPRNGGWQTRHVKVLGWRKAIQSPDTAVFSDRLLSRLLRSLPFLVECCHWALIYWLYQLGHAFTAITIIVGTVHTARKNALRLIHLERGLHIFWEPAIQQFFVRYPSLMTGSTARTPSSTFRALYCSLYGSTT